MTIVELCPVCHGTGWVTTSSSEPYDPVDYEEIARCPNCRGAVIMEKAPVEPKDDDE
jgi:hypothetical protein